MSLIKLEGINANVFKNQSWLFFVLFEVNYWNYIRMFQFSEQLSLSSCNVIMSGHDFYRTRKVFWLYNSLKYWTKIAISYGMLYLIFSHWNTFQYNFYITSPLHNFLPLDSPACPLMQRSRTFIWGKRKECSVIRNKKLTYKR